MISDVADGQRDRVMLDVIFRAFLSAEMAKRSTMPKLRPDLRR